MTRDFLDRLDDAVDGRCACGCGADITEASPSAWFAAEVCSARWHLQAAPRFVVAEVMCRIAEKARELFESLTAALTELFESIGGAVRSFVEAFEPYREADLVQFRLSPARPPHPMNQVDPPGGLNTRPLGRPAFRPRY